MVFRQSSPRYFAATRQLQRRKKRRPNRKSDRRRCYVIWVLAACGHALVNFNRVFHRHRESQFPAGRPEHAAQSGRAIASFHLLLAQKAISNYINQPLKCGRRDHMIQYLLAFINSYLDTCTSKLEIRPSWNKTVAIGRHL